MNDKKMQKDLKKLVNGNSPMVFLSIVRLTRKPSPKIFWKIKNS